MRIVTEMQIRTNDNLQVEVNSLDSNYVVVYNPWTIGPTHRRDSELPLSELRNAVAAGEVHSILLSGIEKHKIFEDEDEEEVTFVPDEEEEEEEEYDSLLIMAASITSIITNDVTVTC